MNEHLECSFRVYFTCLSIRNACNGSAWNPACRKQTGRGLQVICYRKTYALLPLNAWNDVFTSRRLYEPNSNGIKKECSFLSISYGTVFPSYCRIGPLVGCRRWYRNRKPSSTCVCQSVAGGKGPVVSNRTTPFTLREAKESICVIKMGMKNPEGICNVCRTTGNLHSYPREQKDAFRGGV